MKKLKLIFALFFALIIFQPLFAQTTTDNMKVIERNDGLVLRWDTVSVDSAETIWSQAIDATHYDNAIRYYTYTSGVDTTYRTNTVTVDTSAVSVTATAKDTLIGSSTYTIADKPSYGFKASGSLGNPSLTITQYVCFGDPTVNANWIADDVVCTITGTTVAKGTWCTSNTKAPYIKFKCVNGGAGKSVTLAGGIFFNHKD